MYLKVFKSLLIVSVFVSCVAPRVATLEEMVRVKRLVEQARVKMNSAQLTEAEALIYLAQEISPDDPIVSDALGCLAWHRKNNELAELYFKKAISIDPGFENSYLNLAIVLEQKGEIAQAKSLLEKTLKINPLNHKARNNYAGIIFDYALNASDRDSARRELNKAVNSAPEVDRVLKYNIDKFNRSRARIN
jgi:Tfp pilus assembly protein PilF